MPDAHVRPVDVLRFGAGSELALDATTGEDDRPTGMACLTVVA